MLRADRVTYYVGGKPLVRSVSLALEPGKLLALVGPNGAGKSTLLKLLAGDLTPASGQVWLDEKPLGSYSPAELALRRGVMPQSTFLAFAFMAEEVVRMGRQPHQWNRADPRRDEAVIRDAMDRTETVHLAHRTYPTLSGGEQARVTLARVLAQEAPILFLDEPISHLDPRFQHVVLSVARELANRGARVLAVLHDLNLAAMYADQIGMLAGGQLRALGAPWDVLRPELLTQVFDWTFRVVAHPELPCPLVLPVSPGPSDRSVPIFAAAQDHDHEGSLV